LSSRILLMVGTKRGAFLLESDGTRACWSLRGPLASAGWSFGHLSYGPESGAIYAAGWNTWYGAAVWKSPDLGATWTLSSEGITYGDEGPSVKQIWTVTAAHGALYAGVDPAGLFRSDDGGANWCEPGALVRHPESRHWKGGKGGLAVHSIIAYPTDPRQLWIAISGGGVLHTADGGQTWAPRNGGVRSPYRTQKLVMAGDVLYQQNHEGVYRSDDGGLNWTDITAGLPSPFGFPVAADPRDPKTAFVMPHLNEQGVRFMPEGQTAVWRTRDGGATWSRLSEGLPRQPSYVKVLRQGLAVDGLSPAGVYFGTTGGHLYGSRDGGDTFVPICSHLPEIYSVGAAIVSD
jgi:photosystem II stability/assembly factor-like uncharacterized protein